MDLSIFQQRIYERIEYMVYILLNFVLEKVLMPLLTFVSEHFFLAVLMVITLPFVYPLVKGFMDFAYKILGN